MNYLTDQNKMHQYYQILQLNPGATKEKVKKAFRRLAHTYHPDKPGGNAEKFKEISAAYSILSKHLESQGESFENYFKNNDPIRWNHYNPMKNAFYSQWNADRQQKAYDDIMEIIRNQSSQSSQSSQSLKDALKR